MTTMNEAKWSVEFEAHDTFYKPCYGETARVINVRGQVYAKDDGTAKRTVTITNNQDGYFGRDHIDIPCEDIDSLIAALRQVQHAMEPVNPGVPDPPKPPPKPDHFGRLVRLSKNLW